MRYVGFTIILVGAIIAVVGVFLGYDLYWDLGIIALGVLVAGPDLVRASTEPPRQKKVGDKH